MSQIIVVVILNVICLAEQSRHAQTPVHGEETSRGGQKDGDGGSVSVHSGQQSSSLSPPESPRPVVGQYKTEFAVGIFYVCFFFNSRMQFLLLKEDSLQIMLPVKC